MERQKWPWSEVLQTIPAFCSHENSIERLLIGKLIKFRTKTARKSAQSGLPSKCGRRAGTNVDADAGLPSSPVCPLLTDNGLLGVWAALSSSEPSTSNAPLSGAVWGSKVGKVTASAVNEVSALGCESKRDVEGRMEIICEGDVGEDEMGSSVLLSVVGDWLCC